MEKLIKILASKITCRWLSQLRFRTVMSDDAIVRYLLSNADWWFIKNFSAARNIFSPNWVMKIFHVKTIKLFAPFEMFSERNFDVDANAHLLRHWICDFMTQRTGSRFSLKAKCGKFESTAVLTKSVSFLNINNLITFSSVTAYAKCFST